MVEIRPPISLEDIEMAGNTADPVKLDTCNCDHCVSQAKLEQVVRKCKMSSTIHFLQGVGTISTVFTLCMGKDMPE